MYNITDYQKSFSHYWYDEIIDKNNTLIKIRDIFPWREVCEEIAEKFYSSITGRRSNKIRVMVALYLLKPWTKLSDQKLVSQGRTDLLFKAFLGIEPDDIESIPDESSMTRFRKRIGLEGQKIIDNQTRKVLRKAKVIKGRKIASDTTAITFTIPHPTDTGLVTSMINALGDAIRKAHPTTYINKFVSKLVNKSKRVFKQWILFERKGKDEAMKCLAELYKLPLFN